MEPYFNKYYRHFVAGVVLGLIMLIIWLVVEGVKWVINATIQEVIVF